MIDLLPNKSNDGQISYDLGWLIQNEKVTDEEFCAYLLTETSQEIERLVNRLLKSPADRIAAVDQIIFTLLLKRRSFKGRISGKVWLYKLIFTECLKRAPRTLSTRGHGFQRIIKIIDTRLAEEAHLNQFLDTLTQLQALIAILHYGHNLSVDEIALLLRTSPDTIRTDLEQSQQKLIAHQQACTECAAHHSNLASMETALTGALQTNNHLIESARENSSDWSASLLDRLGREKLKQRKRKWAYRVAEISMGLLLLIVAEWAFTQSWPNSGLA